MLLLSLSLTLLLVINQSAGQITQCPTNCVCEYGDHESQLMVTCHNLVAFLNSPLPNGFDQATIRLLSGAIDAIPQGYFENVAMKTLTLEISNMRIGTLEHDLLNARGVTLRVTIDQTHINTIRERAFVVGRIDYLTFNHLTVGTIEKRAFDADTMGRIQWENTHVDVLKKHAITTDTMETMMMTHSSFQVMEHYALQDIDVNHMELNHVIVENDTPFTGLERIGTMQMYHTNFPIMRHETVPSQFPWNQASTMIHNDLNEIQEGTLGGYNILMEERDVCDNRVYCDDRVFWMFEKGRNTLPEPFFRSLICHVDDYSNPRKAVLHTCTLRNRELVDCDYIPAGQQVFCAGDSPNAAAMARGTTSSPRRATGSTGGGSGSSTTPGGARSTTPNSGQHITATSMLIATLFAAVLFF